MEYLSLYDKDGNQVKEKGIRGVKSNYLKGISIIFIENNKGEFLIQKTSPSRGSVFATTGGHVDYGSNFLDTIINEVKEELGVDASNDNILEVIAYAGHDYYQTVFYLKKDIDIEDIVVQKDEVEYVKWLDKNTIEELISNKEFRESNIPGYRYILDNISK